MSKIGTNTNIINDQIKTVITTETFDNLQQIMENNISVGITNGIIISIPQVISEDQSYDDIKNASLWMSDGNGLLYPITYPLSEIEKMIENKIQQNGGS